jgi:hypothetical protein
MIITARQLGLKKMYDQKQAGLAQSSLRSALSDAPDQSCIFQTDANVSNYIARQLAIGHRTILQIGECK